MQKPIVDTQKILRRDTKHSTKESKQTTSKRAREERNKELQKQPESN